MLQQKQWLWSHNVLVSGMKLQHVDGLADLTGEELSGAEAEGELHWLLPAQHMLADVAGVQALQVQTKRQMQDEEQVLEPYWCQLRMFARGPRLLQQAHLPARSRTRWRLLQVQSSRRRRRHERHDDWLCRKP